MNALAEILARYERPVDDTDVAGTPFRSQRNLLAEMLFAPPSTERMPVAPAPPHVRQQRLTPLEADAVADEGWARAEGSPWRRPELLTRVLDAYADATSTPRGAATDFVLSNFLGPAAARIPRPTMAPSGMGGGGGAPRSTGIRAYHGSPKQFDAFDMDAGPAWFATDEGTARAFGRDRMNVSRNSVLKPHMIEASIDDSRLMDVDVPAEAVKAGKPANITVNPESWDEVGTALNWTKYQKDMLAEAEQSGYGGVRFRNVGDSPNGTWSDHIAVFDDSLIEILRKYGLAGLMAGGAAASQQSQEPQQ